MSNPDDTRLTDSDRFVANWLFEKINGLTDEQHQRLAGPRCRSTKPDSAKTVRELLNSRREPGDDDE